MKSIIAYLLVLSSITCRAQDSNIKSKIDSLNSVSRLKADFILSRFDSIQTNKLLYSISNEHYYIILKDGCCYKEYYIHLDSTGKVVNQRLIKSAKRNKEILKKAFELGNYRKEFVTKVDSPKVVQGNNSYFVVKDVSGNKYGEFALAAITVPIPINIKLYNYLFKRLLTESTINKKSAH
jgi:hypothetical protein